MLGLSFQELLIIGVVAVLLFGKNLPEQMKKFGGVYRDFRKSLDDLRSQVDFTEAFNSTPARSKPRPSYSDFDDNDEITAPKFHLPPPAEPPQTGDAKVG
jgi:sec-independent protein translocase protein TatA